MKNHASSGCMSEQYTRAREGSCWSTSLPSRLQHNTYDRTNYPQCSLRWHAGSPPFDGGGRTAEGPRGNPLWLISSYLESSGYMTTMDPAIGSRFRVPTCSPQALEGLRRMPRQLPAARHHTLYGLVRRRAKMAPQEYTDYVLISRNLDRPKAEAWTWFTTGQTTPWSNRPTERDQQ